MSALSDKQFLTVLAVGAVGAYVLYQGVGNVAAAVNPVNPDNIFKQGADELGEAITGDPYGTQDAMDYLFGGLDLVNPWAPEYRKKYALMLYGFES